MSDKNSAKELRAMSAKELSALVRSLREELFNLRLQALAHLGVNPEMQAEETVPEQIGTPLPALAIDGEIVVYGVEPSVRELELLLQDRVQEREADFPCGACGMGCSGMNGPENCPMCIQDGKDGSMAGRIIGFAILLMLLFLAMKILS